MDRFVKCPSCKVNIPKQDLRDVEGDIVCTVCKARLPSDVLSATATAAAAAKTTTKRRWIELKSKRGRTYYHNNDTGEDRWDVPPDFDAVVTVNAADDAPAMVNFKNDDPVRNAILLQQNKQEARKQGVAEDVIETLAAKVAAEQAGNSLQGQFAALEKAQKAAKEAKKAAPQGPPPAPTRAPAPPQSAPADDSTTANQASSCTVM